MFELSGKVAVVTGGGSGIGRAICSVLGQSGADVCILDIDEESAFAVRTEIAKTGSQAFVYTCDVGDQAQVRSAFEAIREAHGHVDILVNNAGIVHIGTVETTAEEDLDRIYRVNVKGVYNCMQMAIPLMREAGGGSIVNMASCISSVGIADRFAYAMSKGAVLTMTYSVAKDFLQDGIRCNCVSPARVHTPFVDEYLKKYFPGQEKETFERLARTQPIGRMGRPEEVAAIVLYLVSDEASFVTGSNFPIDGGFVTLNS